jgi:pimeloyl-ACP methyl ester carboxylesterase
MIDTRVMDGGRPCTGRRCHPPREDRKLGRTDVTARSGHREAEFERTGMSGALGRYRNMDRDREDLAAFDGSPITQPSLFIGGALDASTTWMAAAIEASPATLPGLVSSHILDGCGHWIQQERREEVNEILTGRLAALPA